MCVKRLRNLISLENILLCLCVLKTTYNSRTESWLSCMRGRGGAGEGRRRAIVDKVTLAATGHVLAAENRSRPCDLGCCCRVQGQ